MHICRLMEACILKWGGGRAQWRRGRSNIHLERNSDIHFRTRRIMVNRGKPCGSETHVCLWKEGEQKGSQGFPSSSAGKESARLQCRRLRLDFWVRKIHWRRDRLLTPVFLGFPGVSTGNESARNAGDLGLMPGLGRFPGEGNGYQINGLLVAQLVKNPPVMQETWGWCLCREDPLEKG